MLLIPGVSVPVAVMPLGGADTWMFCFLGLDGRVGMTHFDGRAVMERLR